MPSEKQTSQKLWAHYKYQVLAHSPKIYMDIRTYLKQEHIQVSQVQALIDQALRLPENRSHYTVAFQHIWGYFKKKVSPQEKADFLFILERYQAGQVPASTVIQELQTLLERYPNRYLENSSLLHAKDDDPI